MMADDRLEFLPENVLAPEQGRLLVSEPFLSDPYFRRSVVLLCEYGPDGAFGFMLNRSLDMAINDLLEGVPPLRTSVCIGGPVQSSDLFYLHTFGSRLQGSAPILGDIHLGGDPDQLRAILRTDPDLAKYVRFFVGYSGWSAGQLDQEINDRSWLIASADKRAIMGHDHKDLWSNTLKAMGSAFAPLANFPEDPRHN
ncbi:MAG: YqgE/AlgH family protein [Flavobacteriales bacterium]|nr:YqgE/AlgH family protein [Flavobacteriales bacterium]